MPEKPRDKDIRVRPSVDRASREIIGKIVERRYRILDLAREEETGNVYRAEDLRSSTKVRIKIGMPESRERLEDEFRTLAECAHPLVIRAIDYGIDARSGIPYYTIENPPEHFRPFDVDRFGKNGGVPRTMVRMALVVESLHRRGFAHRRICRDSFLVSDDSLVMLDFSRARRMFEEDTAMASEDWNGVMKTFDGLSNHEPLFSDIVTRFLRGKDSPRNNCAISGALAESEYGAKRHGYFVASPNGAGVLASLDDLIQAGGRTVRRMASEEFEKIVSSDRYGFGERYGTKWRKRFRDLLPKEGCRLLWVTGSDALRLTQAARLLKAECQTAGWMWMENVWDSQFPRRIDGNVLKMFGFSSGDKATAENVIRWLIEGKRNVPSILSIEDVSESDEPIIDFIGQLVFRGAIQPRPAPVTVIVRSSHPLPSSFSVGSPSFVQISADRLFGSDTWRLPNDLEIPLENKDAERLVIRAGASRTQAREYLRELLGVSRQPVFQKEAWDTLDPGTQKVVLLLAFSDNGFSKETLARMTATDGIDISSAIDGIANLGWLVVDEQKFHLSSTIPKGAIESVADPGLKRWTRQTIVEMVEKGEDAEHPWKIVSLAEYAIGAEDARRIRQYAGRAARVALEKGYPLLAMDLWQALLPRLSDDESKIEVVKRVLSVSSQTESVAMTSHRIEKYLSDVAADGKAVLHTALALCYLRSTDVGRAQKSLAIARRFLSKKRRLDWAKLHAATMARWNILGRFSESIDLGIKAIRALSPDDLRRNEGISLLIGLGTTSLYLSQFERAERYYREALVAAGRDIRIPSLAVVHAFRAMTLACVGNGAEALKETAVAERTLDRFRTHQALMETRRIKAFILFTRGEVERAREILLREIRRARILDNRLGSLNVSALLSTTAYEMGDLSSVLQGTISNARIVARQRIQTPTAIALLDAFERFVDLGLVGESKKLQRLYIRKIAEFRSFPPIRFFNDIRRWMDIFMRCETGKTLPRGAISFIEAMFSGKWPARSPFEVCQSLLCLARALRRRDHPFPVVGFHRRLARLARRLGFADLLRDIRIEEIACSLRHDNDLPNEREIGNLLRHAKGRRNEWFCRMLLATVKHRRRAWAGALAEAGAARSTVERMTQSLPERYWREYRDMIMRDIASIDADQIWEYAGMAAIRRETRGAERSFPHPEADPRPSSPAENHRERYRPMIGESPAILRTLSLLYRIESSGAPILIQGESGTGKELAARSIHDNSRRRNDIFLAENCAAIPDSLLESALFGHERGAFTGATERHVGLFEQANGGTLFLDEIAEMSPVLQSSLLRVIETGKFRRVGGVHDVTTDVRLITASNRSVADLVKEGRFRQDLYYRINVITVDLPPLRERPEDIPLLVEHAIGEISRKRGRPLALAPDTLDIMTRYPWPGNVRELFAEIERASVISEQTIRSEHLSERVRNPAGAASPRGWDGRSLRESLESFERNLLQESLAASKGNKTSAAERLRVNRKTFYRKLAEHGIS